MTKVVTSSVSTFRKDIIQRAEDGEICPKDGRALARHIKKAVMNSQRKPITAKAIGDTVRDNFDAGRMTFDTLTSLSDALRDSVGNDYEPEIYCLADMRYGSARLAIDDPTYVDPMGSRRQVAEPEPRYLVYDSIEEEKPGYYRHAIKWDTGVPGSRDEAVQRIHDRYPNVRLREE